MPYSSQKNCSILKLLFKKLKNCHSSSKFEFTPPANNWTVLTIKTYPGTNATGRSNRNRGDDYRLDQQQPSPLPWTPWPSSAGSSWANSHRYTRRACTTSTRTNQSQPNGERIAETSGIANKNHSHLIRFPIALRHSANGAKKKKERGN